MKYRKKAAVLMVLLVFFEIGYLCVLTLIQEGSSNRSNTDTKITAHRGGTVETPENTISALKYTMDCKADCAEIDVQETKDKELILLHDDSFKRTAGVDKKVWEMTYSQVEKLDVSSDFYGKYQGEQIPTLDEVLNFCKGRLDLNIEIKYNGKNEGIVFKVVRAIQEHGFEEHCVVTSMNYQFLEQIHRFAPEIRTGYIMTMNYGNISEMKAADFFSIKYNDVDEEFVQEAHSLGKEVHVWTVNSRIDAEKMIDMGVDNIITDDPVMVRKVQNQKSTGSTGFPWSW